MTLGPGVVRIGAEVHKAYPTPKAARKAFFLYASFPGHVAATRREGTGIVYPYVEGETLAEMLARGEVPQDVLTRVGRHLAEVHFGDPSLAPIAGYTEVVRARGLLPDPSVLTHPSLSYRATVHGDLHPGNVVVTPGGGARFIDRMRIANDVLWDLPLLLSLLCLHRVHRERRYLDGARAFAEGWLSGAPRAPELERGLLYNLLAFAHHAARYAPTVPEWAQGPALSRELAGAHCVLRWMDQRKV